MATGKVPGEQILVLCLSLVLGCFLASPVADFNKDVQITWGGDRAQVSDRGKSLFLTLDTVSGSGFQSNDEYLFGRIDMEIKLVSGNSAGTVTAYYLSSQGKNRDEIDFEFLGNLSGDPYTVHTNVYTQGTGGREMQFNLWFDPTIKFHLYSIVWNPQRIIFLVDNIPIRVYENEESIGVPFPKEQPMRVYSTLWDADQWATRGGQVKTNWSNAPFRAYYRNFRTNACLWSRRTSSCASDKKASGGMSPAWQTQTLDVDGRRKLRWIQMYHMIYNYCADFRRFPHGRPRECRHTRF